MWVVKIGGSLAYSELLPAWLDALACYGNGKTVIVPGGGPFADQVRDVQGHWGFDDALAHRMAILAMEQYGLVLLGLRPDLVPVASAAEILKAWECSRVPVWLPTKMLLSAADIPPSWSVTSDSLAAWLAATLDAQRLVLVKAVPFTDSAIPYQRLVEHGIVDSGFQRFAQRGRFKTWLCGPEDAAALKQALYSDAPCGALMLLEAGAASPSTRRSTVSKAEEPLAAPASKVRPAGY